jgi:carboxypeptidase Q
MMFRIACAVACAMCFSFCAHAQERVLTPVIAKNCRTLTGDIYANGQSLELLGHIADDFGPRLAGSENYERAAAFAVERFHAMGFKDVRLEPVTLRHGWKRGHAEATLLGAHSRSLHVAAFGWSPPTPSEGLRGRVATLTDSTDAAIDQAQVKGSIVVIDRAVFTGPVAFQNTTPEDFERQRRYDTIDRRLHDAGALALLIYTKTVNQVLRTSDPVPEGEALALPMGSIGHEDALLLQRQMKQGTVEIELRLDTTLTGPVTLNNVIAERRGSSKPEEIVMLGAHLDSWDLGTGAQDNGSGVAQVMDAARAIAALPTAPRRTLRFALWASEEQGLNGSMAYVRAHGHEMKQFVAYLNTDTGAGRPLGWNVSGRPDTEHALSPLKPMLARIGGSGITRDLQFDTDSGSFLIAGVPALNLDVVEDQYDSVVHHKPADTLDKVDDHDLTAGAAMLAVTAYAFADGESRPAQRLSWPAVQDLLKKGGALDYVLTSNMKDLWQP